MAALEMRIRARQDKVWTVVGDAWGDCYLINPTLTNSRLLGDEALGVGSVRECTLAKPFGNRTTVRERLVEWRPMQSFAQIMEDAPWPIAQAGSTWSLDGDGDETVVTLTPRVVFRGGRFTSWLAPLALRMLAKGMQEELPAMTAAIEKRCATKR